MLISKCGICGNRVCETLSCEGGWKIFGGCKPYCIFCADESLKQCKYCKKLLCSKHMKKHECEYEFEEEWEREQREDLENE